VVAALTEVPLALREAMRDGPADRETHRRYFSGIAALREIEAGGKAPSARAIASIRVAVWNVERLRHVDAVAALLMTHRPEVVLLSEVDKGMVRSGNRHGLADLAHGLGQAFVYGVEFVELGFGDPNEVPSDSTERNALGFHGNALTSAIRLRRPFLSRLEREGGWFGPERGQPRVGGRMAIGAQIELDGRPVTLVSVHLESNSDPFERAAQVTRLLESIEAFDASSPILIGGDFNTSTVNRRSDRDREFGSAQLRASPQRLIEVEPHEPLFAEMARRGFEWRRSNVPGQPTERTQPGMPARPLGKIDWIFTRGLEAKDPAVIPAVAADGAPISDHDCLLVTVSIAP
jgi:endonuclease/exonuclease/phosphatase family metal-dependent hydrolase